ncbi:MAG: PRC-barrel domain-containing protein [Actinomycetota bacterium]|nr:PRC-barrel domain-containing protein [Actinomycetota bacterium]MDQ6947739.1 PRC-barrel domain-containing protein [Actinomycetota bacterium]
MAFIENLKDWTGKDVLGSDGEKIGRLADTYYDAETDVAQFLVVETGALRKHLVLVPAGGATGTPDHLTLPVAKDAVDNAPTIDAGDLSAEDEQRAFEHYGFEYSPASTPGGRRLVRH